ncbi:DUF3466 family protein [Paraglaciecola aquimarina]|uniref:DUF3466 family protein n=1 Tax=Paraglaciecola algarum TaxID=3050085 RepID=A0ABS9D2J6_9ALTE|nr:DUF3466 family protein [Paraglaciecola sp. G1-23]MCF2947135.1 DUF3466 family protein [Paraglaciecola sp. G1-23]
MIKTRLAVALSLALLTVSNVHGAKYKVVELPVADKGYNSFPTAINESGNITVNVKEPYNTPIDIELLDFEQESFTDNLTDIDAAKSGNFNLADYSYVLSGLTSNQGSQFIQKIANITSYSATEVESSFIPGFGSMNADGQPMMDTGTLITDINEAGYTVGRSQGGFYKLPYVFAEGTEEETNTTFVLSDFSTHGFVSINGQIIDLLPIDVTLGGISDATGINNNNQVVGFGTTFFDSEAVQTSIDTCVDEELNDQGVLPRGDLPVESCISSLFTAYASEVSSHSQIRGLIWQLDDSGNIIETKELGLLLTPDAEDESKYNSSAVAINDNGIAVGQAPGEYVSGDTTVIRNYAVVYNGDEVINITPDVDINIARSTTTLSTASDINNNDLVVGYQPKSINGSFRTKFFVYDVNTSELTFPEDFFLGSSSVAFDINNHGQVVGYGEIEATQTARRTGGFIYDHQTQEFSGLNDMIGCDSPYSIVQANAINDSGEIAATALIQAPLRNVRGDLLLNDDGTEILRDQVVAVKLEPIVGGTIDDCEGPETGENRERQGASLIWLLPLSLGLLLVRRRKVKSL